jgi:arylsulfatase A-like enzyme
VVLDDVGFGAADAFGGLIETPHIRRLAAIAAMLHEHGYASFGIGKYAPSSTSRRVVRHRLRQRRAGHARVRAARLVHRRDQRWTR